MALGCSIISFGEYFDNMSSNIFKDLTNFHTTSLNPKQKKQSNNKGKKCLHGEYGKKTVSAVQGEVYIIINDLTVTIQFQIYIFTIAS